MGEYPAKLLHLIRVASLSQGEIMEVSRISVRLLHLCGDSIQKKDPRKILRTKCEAGYLPLACPDTER